MRARIGNRLALPKGFLLNGYRVSDILGMGGFGITYLVEGSPDGGLAAIKEYLPNEVAVRDGSVVLPKSSEAADDFEWGLARFLDEAKTLARFEHPQVVRVNRYFEANNTAYIVMEYEDGKPLSALLETHGTLAESLLKRVLWPLLDGLREVHAQHFLHRDIKPSNIYIRRRDESPVLLDFGAARQAIGRRSRQVTAFITAGYSPPEQYGSTGEQQGPWTDVYALAALCYRAITGEAPPDSSRRQHELSKHGVDPALALAEQAHHNLAAYSRTLLRAVDWGLRLDERSRPQDIDEWAEAMGGLADTAGALTMPVDSRTTEGIAVPTTSLVRIGRGRDMDVSLPHGSVSRLHAELSVAPPSPMDGGMRPRYVIEDCGSSNGTFVLRDGRWRQVRKEVVFAQDRLRLGDYETSPEVLVDMAIEWLANDDHLDWPGSSVARDDGDPIGQVGLVDGPVRRDRRSGEVVRE